MGVLRTLSLATLILVLSPDAGSAADAARPAARTPRAWLVTTPDFLKSSGPPADDRSELLNLKAVISRRSPTDVQRILW